MAPSPVHKHYTETVTRWLQAQPPQWHNAILLYAEAIVVLAHLDLGPALDIVRRCYATRPRGQKPHDPLAMLRACLLMVLSGEVRVDLFVERARAQPLLCVLAGFEPGHFPGVGTFYDFFHRIADGDPALFTGGHTERPSVSQRRRARTPRPRASSAAKKRDQLDGEAKTRTQALVDELLARKDHPLPDDFTERLGRLLLEVAVVASAQRGLLGKTDKLIACGDGSVLRTGANGQGRRVCACSRYERCDCPRLYADGDARWGYDSHRKCYFFGHHFWELTCCSQGHDLPLALSLEAGNASDHTQGPATLDAAIKRLAGHSLRIDILVEDAGHDSQAKHNYLRAHGISPVIPLAGTAPAFLPGTDIALSTRGVPQCQAGVEMVKNGSAGAGRQVWMCAVKAGRCQTCPLAASDTPDWVCDPDTRHGPTHNIDAREHSRLLPPIARNTRSYARHYRLRGGSERSNSVKKVKFKLEAARHRLATLWHIRLTLMAILQHAMAWVAGIDAQQWVRDLLGGGNAECQAA